MALRARARAGRCFWPSVRSRSHRAFNVFRIFISFLRFDSLFSSRRTSTPHDCALHCIAIFNASYVLNGRTKLCMEIYHFIYWVLTYACLWCGSNCCAPIWWAGVLSSGIRHRQTIHYAFDRVERGSQLCHQSLYRIRHDRQRLWGSGKSNNK